MFGTSTSQGSHHCFVVRMPMDLNSNIVFEGNLSSAGKLLSFANDVPSIRMNHVVKQLYSNPPKHSKTEIKRDRKKDPYEKLEAS